MILEEFIKSISFEGEIWKDVVGYESIYMVSNKARVLSISTTINDKLRNRKKAIKLLKASECIRNGKHYQLVSLAKNKRVKNVYLHRVVANSFVPNPNGYNEIDHIDRNGLNNDPTNLRWVTHRMNQNNPLTKIAMSISQTNVKQPTKWKSVVMIKDGVAVKTYHNITSVAKDGFIPSGVVQTLKGKNKSHKGYAWMYLEDYEKLLSISMSKNVAK